jgi:hypothetical protein
MEARACAHERGLGVGLRIRDRGPRVDDADELHRDRVLLSDGEVVEVIAVRDDSTVRGRWLDEVCAWQARQEAVVSGAVGVGMRPRDA